MPTGIAFTELGPSAVITPKSGKFEVKIIAHTLVNLQKSRREQHAIDKNRSWVEEIWIERIPYDDIWLDLFQDCVDAHTFLHYPWEYNGRGLLPATFYHLCTNIWGTCSVLVDARKIRKTSVRTWISKAVEDSWHPWFWPKRLWIYPFLVIRQVWLSGAVFLSHQVLYFWGGL